MLSSPIRLPGALRRTSVFTNTPEPHQSSARCSPGLTVGGDPRFGDRMPMLTEQNSVTVT